MAPAEVNIKPMARVSACRMWGGPSYYRNGQISIAAPVRSRGGQFLLNLVDRGADASRERRLAMVDQQQLFGGAGHGHIQQSCLVRFVEPRTRQCAKVGNGDERKFQTLARMHGDDAHRVIVEQVALAA